MIAKKTQNARKHANGDRYAGLENSTVKDLVKAVDSRITEIGKRIGYGPDYRKAKTDWGKLGRKFCEAAAAKAVKGSKPAKSVKPADSANGSSTETPARKKAARPCAKKTAKPSEVRTGKALASPEPPKPDVPKAARPKSVVITPYGLECYIGSFPIEALAQRDATEFLSHDRVFWYRRALFPDPTVAKVQPKVVSARVVERKGAQFTRAPYTVAVTISIQGDKDHCMAWAEGVVNKNRGDQE